MIPFLQPNLQVAENWNEKKNHKNAAYLWVQIYVIFPTGRG